MALEWVGDSVIRSVSLRFSVTHMDFIAGRNLVNELSFYFSSGSRCVDVKCCEHPSLIKSLICNVVLNISDTYTVVKKDNFLVFDFYPKMYSHV